MEEYFKWKNRSILIANNNRKQIMTSMIMLCFSEPFRSDSKAEKSTETYSFFSHAYSKDELLSNENNQFLMGLIETCFTTIKR